MTDRIKQAIADHDIEDLANALQDAGVECEIDDDPAEPGVLVHGYGLVWWANQPGAPSGWVVRENPGVALEEADHAIEPDELADELRDVVDHVQRISD